MHTQLIIKIIFVGLFLIGSVLLYISISNQLATFSCEIHEEKFTSREQIQPTEMEKFATIYQLTRYLESSEAEDVISQNKEEYFVQALLNVTGIQHPGFFVEIGIKSFQEYSTRQLRDKFNWKGLLMEGSKENKDIDMHKEMVKHDNVLEILEKYGVKSEFDLFIENTDYEDYWIVEKVLTRYKPKIIVHEVNQKKAELCVTVPKPVNLTFWDGSSFHGGSVCAFYCLANRFHYTMVYCRNGGASCVMVRNDLLSAFLKVQPRFVQLILNPFALQKQLSWA